jgi:hypothetical protein
MAKSFILIDGELYKRAASGVLQLCVPIPQGRELLLDIHAGVCGHHAAPRTLVGNASRQGFYWPTAVADASEIVRLLGLVEVGPRRVGGLPFLLRARHGGIWGGEAGA